MVLLLGLLLAAGGPPVLSPPELFARVSPGVGLVVAGESLGSVVAVSPHRVVTNWHVVRDSIGTSLPMVKLGGVTATAVVVGVDVERDLAVLQLLESSAKFVPHRRSGLPPIGDSVFTIGAPQGLENSFAGGMVSGIHASKTETLIQTNAAISHGSSGGGLFDDRGRLVGITVGMLKDGQQLNFAVPVSAVEQLLGALLSQSEAAQSIALLTPELNEALERKLSRIEAASLFRLKQQQAPATLPASCTNTSLRDQTKALLAFTKRFSSDKSKSELVIEATRRTAECWQLANLHELAKVTFAAAANEFDKRGLEVATNPIAADAAAVSRFQLAEYDFQEFDTLKIGGSGKNLEESFTAKKNSVKAVSGSYDKVLKYRRIEWTLAAFYRKGYLLERFGQTIRQTPIPPEVTRAGEESVAEYQGLLTKQAEALNDKAVQNYLRTLEEMRKQRVSNNWTQLVIEALDRLQPTTDWAAYPSAPEAVAALDPPPAIDSSNVAPSTWAPIGDRAQGRIYVRLFMKSSCVADVDPGSIQARTGDLLLLPFEAKALQVKSPCEGVAEVYFGREPRPRISEKLRSNRALKLEFKR